MAVATSARARGRQKILTVEVLKVGQLDPLAHAQDEGGVAQAIDQHPDVAAIKGRYPRGSLGARGSMAVQGMLDVRPRSDDGAHHHQPEGDQGQTRDRASEPKHLAIRDEDDGKVLEDGVDRDREELKSLASSVDHSDQEEGNREP